MLTREEIFRKAELIGVLEERIKSRLKNLSVLDLTQTAILVTQSYNDDEWDTINELRKLENK